MQHPLGAPIRHGDGGAQKKPGLFGTSAPITAATSAAASNPLMPAGQQQQHALPQTRQGLFGDANPLLGQQRQGLFADVPATAMQSGGSAASTSAPPPPPPPQPAAVYRQPAAAAPLGGAPLAAAPLQNAMMSAPTMQAALATPTAAAARAAGQQHGMSFSPPSRTSGSAVMSGAFDVSYDAECSLTDACWEKSPYASAGDRELSGMLGGGEFGGGGEDAGVGCDIGYFRGVRFAVSWARGGMAIFTLKSGMFESRLETQ